jgi:hypothetical protein
MSKCPNVKSKAWQDLLNVMHGDQVKAYKAYMKNNEEIPELDNPIIEDVKKINLDFGNEKNFKISLDSNLKESDTYVGDDGTKLNRVTGVDSKLINSFSYRKKDSTLDFAERNANAMWGKLDHSIKLMTDKGNNETWEENVERKRKELKLAQSRGKIFHYYMNSFIHPENQSDNVEKISILKQEFVNELGISSIDDSWMGNKEIAKKIFKNVGINILADVDDGMPIKDNVKSEQTVVLEELGYAGTIDVIAEHHDGTITLVDWKTGRSFTEIKPGAEDVLMKYGQQANMDISDTTINRAKLQVMWYAIMLKANNPGMKFRKLVTYPAPRAYEATIGNSEQYVDVDSFLNMIKSFVSDKEALRNSGLPENTYEILTSKDKNIFQSSEYDSGFGQDVSNEQLISNQSTEEVLDKKLAELQSIVAKYPGSSFKKGSSKRLKMSEDDEAEVLKLQKDISEIQKDPTLIPVGKSFDMKFLTKWIGNYGDMKHPMALSWLRFRDKRVRTVETKMIKLMNDYDTKAKRVIDEWEGKNNVRKAGKQTFYDQSLPYQYMYVEENITGLSYNRERLLTKHETNPNLAERYNKLTKNQKDLLDFVNDNYGKYFTNKDAFVNKTARTIGTKTQSHLDVYNQGLLGNNKFRPYDGFFPKVPLTDQENKFRYSNSLLGGTFNPKRYRDLTYRTLTSFIENEYQSWNNKAQDLPLQYIGDSRIEKSKMYSKNMRVIFAKGMESIIRKEELDAVYALGKVTAMRLGIGEQDGPAYEMTAQFLDDKLMSDIQRKLSKSSDSARKLRIPMYTLDGWKKTPVEVDKVIRTIMNWSGATIMWLRPLQGAGNGIHATYLTHREGIKASLGKRLFGISGTALDFTESDIAWGEKEYFSSFGKDALFQNLHKNKVWLFAKELNYLGDNFDYQFNEKTILNPKNNYMQRHGAYLFHSIPEEKVSMTTMLAQLHHMKNETTGKSLYESYDVVETEPGSGIYALKWIGGTRGYVKQSDGSNREIKELMPEEIYSMKKVHERMQGGYRREEAATIEMYALGKSIIQLKKYLPRLIINALHSKKAEPHLLEMKHLYDPVTGKDLTKEDENGKPVNVYEMIRRRSEGRWITTINVLAYYLSAGNKNAEYAFKNLNNEQKMNLIDGSLTFLFYMSSFGAYTIMFGDTEDDNTFKKWWKNYLVDNAGQQWNPLELSKTMKDAMSPVMFTKIYNTTNGIAQTMWSTINYVAGNEDEAFTTTGHLKGANEVIKGIPQAAFLQDAYRKVTNATDDENSWFYIKDDMRFR